MGKSGWQTWAWPPKTRPVVIVSRSDEAPPRDLVVYVPLTTQNRESPYEVVLPRLSFLREVSVANVQGIGSLARARLERPLGRVPADSLLRIKEALRYALDL